MKMFKLVIDWDHLVTFNGSKTIYTVGNVEDLDSAKRAVVEQIKVHLDAIKEYQEPDDTINLTKGVEIG